MGISSRLGMGYIFLLDFLIKGPFTPGTTTIMINILAPTPAHNIVLFFLGFFLNIQCNQCITIYEQKTMYNNYNIVIITVHINLYLNKCNKCFIKSN